MAIFPLGSIIKKRREELGLTQEDLADGICSVPTLSRIENGERMPTKNHYEMLMQRLGYSTMSLDFFTDNRDFEIHELKFKIRHAYVARDRELVRKSLCELEGLLTPPTIVDQQFVTLYQTLLDQKRYTNAERLEKYENALQLTCPKYRNNHIPHVLSYEEIILLNNIAICHNGEGNHNRAISILFTLKDYYDRHIINSEEALRTQPMVLYNLSKILGLVGRYDECIEICNVGIRLARTTGRCLDLGGILFNRAWALLKRGQIGDRELAKCSLEQAYHFSVIMGNEKDVNIICEFYTSTFPDGVLK